MLVAYDLLEQAGATCVTDRWTRAATRWRACSTGDALAPARLRLSPRVEAADWDDVRAAARRAAREVGAEGLMLKRRDQPVRRRPAPGRLVEVEGRSAQRGRGADLRPAGQRPAGRALHRLHLRRLGRRRRSCRSPRRIRASPTRRSGEWTPSSGATRSRSSARAHGQAGARLRARLRGHPALDPPQVRRRRALSPDGALAHRQAGATRPTRSRRCARSWATHGGSDG